uniref:Craniofacial development protein 2-like n=1 Tax=Nicotiana tabacum TaxID=4097 RepID=A0A1S3XLP5_TOBAC|nr:PREDICTED: uncharacterized protein LOC107766571 [Nicotiana tabacum]
MAMHFSGRLVAGGKRTRKSSKAIQLVGTRVVHRVSQHTEYNKSKVHVIFKGIGTSRLLFLFLICTYAPQAGLDEEVKRRFWKALDEVVRGTSPTEKLFIRGDFNGHIGTSVGGYGEVHGGFGFGLQHDIKVGTPCSYAFNEATPNSQATTFEPKQTRYSQTFTNRHSLKNPRP